jgi:hypothetical protein
MKKNLLLILGIGGVVLFWLYIFKIFPLGVFLSIVGGVMATYSHTTEKSARLAGSVLSWLYPIGVILTFVNDGFLWAIVSIIAGFVCYKLAKQVSLFL